MWLLWFPSESAAARLRHNFHLSPPTFKLSSHCLCTVTTKLCYTVNSCRVGVILKATLRRWQLTTETLDRVATNSVGSSEWGHYRTFANGLENLAFILFFIFNVKRKSMQWTFTFAGRLEVFEIFENIFCYFFCVVM